MIKMDMKFAEALAIAYNFKNDKYTDEQRLKAIYMIKDAPTLNSISKDKLQNALNWLFDYCFEDAEEPQTNYDRIKAMSIDELADMVQDISAGSPPWCGQSCDDNCAYCVKKWLESGVQEDA